MDLRAIRAIGFLTFKDTIRAKWLIFFSVVFFLLAVNVPSIALLLLANLPPDYTSTYLALLVTLSFPYLPLLALPMAATSIVMDRESGALQYVLSNPISRFEFLMGRLGGLFAATTTVVALGYGTAALYAYNTSLGHYGLVVTLMLIAILLNAVGLSMALLVSVVSRRFWTALGTALFIWFIMSVLTDTSSTGVVIAISKSPVDVMPMIILNPIQASSVLALLQMHLANDQIGIAYAAKVLLGTSANPILVGSLIAWAAIALAACVLSFRRQDMI